MKKTKQEIEAITLKRLTDRIRFEECDDGEIAQGLFDQYSDWYSMSMGDYGGTDDYDSVCQEWEELFNLIDKNLGLSFDRRGEEDIWVTVSVTGEIISHGGDGKIKVSHYLDSEFQETEIESLENLIEEVWKLYEKAYDIKENYFL